MMEKGMSIYAIITLIGLFLGALATVIWSSYSLSVMKDEQSQTQYYLNILWFLLGVFFMWIAYTNFVDCWKTGCPTLGTFFLISDAIDWMFDRTF